MWLDKIPLTSISPMEIIHMDLFKYMGGDYLSIHDQVSTYCFMFELRHTNSKEILMKIR